MAIVYAIICPLKVRILFYFHGALAKDWNSTAFTGLDSLFRLLLCDIL